MKTPQEQIEEALQKYDDHFARDFATDSEYSDAEMVDIMSNVIKENVKESRDILKKELTSLHRTILQRDIEELEGLRRGSCCDCEPEEGYGCYHAGWESCLDRLIEHKKKLLEDVK